MICINRYAHIAILAALLGLTLPCSATAQTPGFFDGKRITIVTAGTSGAGLDAYVRLVARYYGRHIPGQPAIIVQNMPGAGSYQAAEYIETQSARDGTAIGSVFPGAIMAPLLDAQNPRFDPTKFNYLGTAETGPRVCVTFHTSKIKTYDDTRKAKTIVAASQAGGSSRDYALMANALAATQFQLVSGYKGGADMFLALERGEVEGLCAFDWSTIKAARGQWLTDGKLNILMQFGLTKDTELSKLGVPDFFQHVSAADRPAAELVIAQQVFSRMFFVPAQVPADRVATLRQAFMATMRDKEFLAESGKAQLNIDPLSGEKVEAIVKQIYGSSPDAVARAKKALQPPG